MAGNRANPEALPLRELAASATVEQFDTSARVPREGSFRRFANAHPVATDLLVGGLYLIPILALVALAAPSFRISEPDPV
ncbi:MAG: hypothetical protein LBH68_02790 [Bifidobacteriaceae bacterium]|jgi:hypothetical protein|nr:hypothetical protein [Bifidobacteriaceae bacterium]